MAGSPEEKRSFTQEFFFFLKTFGIIGLAIAFVIGQAASALVNAAPATTLLSAATIVFSPAFSCYPLLPQGLNCASDIWTLEKIVIE
jgi:hypothetical protein